MRFPLLIFFVGICASLFAQEGGLPGRRKVVQTTKNDSEKAAPKRTRSKIVNDSVKQVYGPKTTLSTTEKEIFENKKNYVPLDTSIFNIHRWDFVQKNENKYQDLGNVGTALNPIFPQISGVIGATPGYKVYDPYYESAEPRFYNTKSPFSRINVIWGGRGRAITHIEFTRNITPRWNFGINYRPVLAAAQIAYSGNRNYQVTSHYYDFYTSFESKNGKYKLLLDYRRIRHHVKENGGVFLDTTITKSYRDYFDPNAAGYFSVSADKPVSTDELRNSFHVSHQFQLAKPAQLYHILDINRQVNSFQCQNTAEAAKYFTKSFTDTTVVNDVNSFQSFQNEFGLKGNAAFLFYDFYYKLRSYSNSMTSLKSQALSSFGTENYIGSRIVFKYDSLSYLSGQAEYLLDGHYKIEGALRTPWLDADLRNSLAKPGFMQQTHKVGFNQWSKWSNNFTDILSSQLSGRIKAKVGPLFISPGITYTALHNYIYFASDTITQRAIPKQSGYNQQIVSPEVQMEIRFLKRFHLRPQVIYTTLLNNDDHAISIPTWFSNVQLSYENTIFKGALQLQVGFDAHYKSAYKALGYATAIQQYYVQESFSTTPFWSTDFFLNGRIKRGRFFVKYINLVQAFTGQGYMPTPYYPNVPSTIDFGFELILFD